MLNNQRVLPLESGINFRELGGYTTKDGRHVKYHKILRSAKLNELDNNDLAYLHDYGLITDVDFRSNDEKVKEPDKLPTGATYKHIPVFAVDETENSKTPQELEDELRYEPNTGYKRMIRVYQNMVRQAGSQAAYRQFFAELLANDQENHALLFHCTAGKDRTGMGAFYLLSALGVDQKTIEQDYLLTNQTYKKQIDAVLAELRANHATPEMIESVHNLVSVNIDFIHAAETQIEQIAGTPINYLKEVLGLNDSDLQDLQKIYLD
ncbi:tyrosine-protein phosphatase [Agrilactobacillus fermenti]|uniref:tyrosine-protein phosphatase n=1 Tax=Agrilactobacillus fermenti TaxID=2586909 RepID=UPI001E356F27|nr:tyrosine-protein phosphatase [Agrilactobacillus fermenti]